MPVNSRDMVLQAFLKVKSDAYFDKNRPILRQRIVKYEGNRFTEEGNAKFISKITALEKALFTGSDDEWNGVAKRILDSIGFLAMPKSLKDPLKNDKPINPEENNETLTIIRNRCGYTPTIDHLQLFIDMDVEGFILGMMWVLFMGIKLDQGFSDCSYGNRVRKTIRDSSSFFDWKPYLFEPYFAQYEKWRDGALDIAQRILRTDHKDAVIVMLDIKSFYYSVHFEDSDWRRLREETASKCFDGEVEDDSDSLNDIERRVAERLHEFVRQVITTYSRCVYEQTHSGTDSHFKESFESVLPIGFHPSQILANWCLDKFDNTISSTLNPAFYGRYVDDIIIVEKVERKSDLYDALQDDGASVEEVLDDMLCHRSNLLSVDSGEEDMNALTRVLNQECLNVEGSQLRIQYKKVKMFYFNHDAPDALISEFRGTIARNTSMFKLMPMVDGRDLNGSFSIVYELKNDGSPNKLRDVQDIKIDSYELSKFLGQLQRIVPVVNQGLPSNLAKNLVNLLEDSDLLKSYGLWERLFTCLLSMGATKELIELIKRISDVVNKFAYDVDNDPEPALFYGWLADDAVLKARNTLRKSALYSLERALAPFENDVARTLITKIEQDARTSEDAMLFWGIDDSNEINNSIQLYRSTFMMDKYTVALPPFITVPALFGGRKTNWMGSLLSLHDSYALMRGGCSDEGEGSSKACIGIYGASVLDGKESGSFPTTIPLYPYVIKTYDVVAAAYHYHMAMGSSLSNCQVINQFADKTLYAIVHRKALAEDKRTTTYDNYLSRLSNIHQPDILISEPKAWQQGASNPRAFFLDMHYSDGIGSRPMKLAIANIRLKESDVECNVQGRPNRSLKRYESIRSILSSAAKNRVDMVLMPELAVPIEWLSIIAGYCLRESIAVVCGIEHVLTVRDETTPAGYNLTAVLLPYTHDKYPYVSLTFHSKVHWADVESKLFLQYGYKRIEGNSFELFRWRDVWFPVYCCLELSSITDRARFKSYADLVLACEWNKDTNHFANIIKSLSRDLECYCCQANNSYCTKPLRGSLPIVSTT